MEYGSKDDLALYDLERHLFGSVHNQFRADGSLGAFELMCIVSWKANRAKSKVAARLLKKGQCATLEEAARKLTRAVAARPSPMERLEEFVHKWGFRIPMATAILAVLYPEEFTVCDVRVAEQVGVPVPEVRANFHTTWEAYLRFREAVKRTAPAGLCLRDKDRYLWARSFREQLEADIRDWETPAVGKPADDLRLYIGGFPGPYITIRTEEGGLVHSLSERGEENDNSTETKVIPTGTDWGTFWTEIGKLGVWKWQARYDNPHVMDGTQWAVDIRRGSKKIRAIGNNLYPGTGGSPMDWEDAHVFHKFCKAVVKLLGGLKFQ